MNILPKRFSEKIDNSGECWLWKASIYKNGYGHYFSNKKDVYAHRYSYSQFFGEIPDGMLVLHKCDVRNCVNPDHLFLGTHRDNSIDMYSKGRGNDRNIPFGDDHWSRRKPELVARGEKNATSKLSDIEVYEIRNSYHKGTNIKNEFSMNGLSKKYGVSQGQIFNIIHNISRVSV